MEKKKTKYDTNPLDPDFVRRTEEVRAATSDVKTPGATAEEQTRRIDSGGVDMEAPTRYYPQPAPQFDAPPSQYEAGPGYEERGNTSYPSVFIPPVYQPPQNYQPPVATPYAPARPFAHKQAPTSRTVPGISIPENLAMILPYLPFPLVGAVPGVVELLLVPRTESRVRFHAAQGLALHLLVLIVSALFSSAESLMSSILHGPAPFMLRLASVLFTIASTIFFITSMIRVWKGEPHTVAQLAEATDWLNRKLDPKK
jgi:uncharacterized membrane protein